MSDSLYDVAIVGAGPAGLISAIILGKAGLKVALVEKKDFPKNKICGDALSMDVINQLKMIDRSLYNQFIKLEKIQSIKKARIIANNKSIVIDIKKGMEAYTCQRIIFDNFLFGYLQQNHTVSYMPNTEVVSVDFDENHANIECSDKSVKAKMIIAADGMKSALRKKVFPQTPPVNKAITLRTYFKNVDYPLDEMLLYFQKDALPGYFWLFPLQDNIFNVGIGIDKIDHKNMGKSLKELFTDIISNDPCTSHYFKNAEQLERLEAKEFDIRTNNEQLSNDRILFVGDAALLIDTLSGEGVANSIRSARFASDHILKCISENQFDAAFNQKYNHRIAQSIFPEFKTNKILVKILRSKVLFNTLFYTYKLKLDNLLFPKQIKDRL